jgi:serine protease Do
MTILSKTTISLASGAAAFAIIGAATIGGISAPVLAKPVAIEAPQTVPNFADAVEAVSPAVVSVKVKTAARPASFQGGSDALPQDHPFRRFFDREFRHDNDRRGRRDAPRRFATSLGSGFFVSADGYIVTNNHVIDQGTEFTVVLNDGEELDATLVGADPKTDLAVLKVDTDDQPYVSFADEPSRVGEWVVAVGNPFGLGGTVTAGIISGMNRDIGSGPYDDFLQIDAAVNKGNSGGPAFNLSGEVVGVNTAIFSPSGGNVGIAFAISARAANEVVSDLIDSGSVTRGWLGVQIQPVTEDIARSLNLDDAQGTIVAEAQGDSPALAAGIEAGDIITAVDGKVIEGPRELARVIAAYEPGKTVELTIIRDGRERALDVNLGTLPGGDRRAAVELNPESGAENSVELADLGLSVIEQDGAIVVADIVPDSAAAEKGLRRGDEIVSINGLEVDAVDSVGKAIAEAIADERKAVLFQLRTGDRSRFVALPMDETKTNRG